MNTMTLEEIQNMMEELEAEIEEKRDLLKSLKKMSMTIMLIMLQISDKLQVQSDN